MSQSDPPRSGTRREKRRQKRERKKVRESQGERRRERFAGYNRKAQLTNKYHLPGLAHLRVRERETRGEREGKKMRK
jgi:hypothetical protein